MFVVFYQLLAALLWVATLIVSPFILPFFPKIRSIFFKRFLFISKPFRSDGIWIHFASFGEARAVKPIVDLMPKDTQLNITVGTKTGFNEAQKLYPDADIKFLPFELFLPFWITRQRALIVFDAELWFNLFYFAQKKGAKTALFNARISDKSLKTYTKYRWFFAQIFKYIDFVFAQSQLDKKRLIDLDANAELLGNIKLLINPQIKHIFTKPNDLITTVASSHEEEEILISTAWKNAKIGGKLLVVPRHPERFLKAYEELLSLDLTVSLFSKNSSFDADIVVVDLMGVLNEIYAISDVVVLGGSFTNRGGHNPIEPAFFGCKIITGKNISNQKPLFDALENIQIVEPSDLMNAIKNSLNFPKPTLKNPLTKNDLKKALDRVL